MMLVSMKIMMLVDTKMGHDVDINDGGGDDIDGDRSLCLYR